MGGIIGVGDVISVSVYISLEWDTSLRVEHFFKGQFSRNRTGN